MGCKNITEQTKHRLQAYNIDKINTTPILTDCKTLHLFQRFGNPAAEEEEIPKAIQTVPEVIQTDPENKLKNCRAN
jgi:hypothetical protein